MRPIGLPVRVQIQIPRNTNVCWQCSRRLLAAHPPKRTFSKTSLPRASASISGASRLKDSYFISNGILDRLRNIPARKSVASTAATAPEKDSSNGASVATALNEDFPHRRRQAARRAAAIAAATSTSTSTTESPQFSSTETAVLPQNASDILTNVAASQPAHSLRRYLSAILSLSKPRLTVLVVLTAMAPYALYPVPAFLSSTAALVDAPSLSPLTLLFLTSGTTLCSASANALNMLYEPDTDSKMSRTRNRPLVRNLLSKRTAWLFALAAGGVGIGALYLGVNPTVAFLGAANIVLYAGVYTPMKRLSWLNTWVGAFVGGIPPLMGWAAAAGESATGDGTFRELLFASDGSSVGGWLLAGLLFAWQFPHFMALSWSIGPEYKAAGLKMLSWMNPARNSRVALRYSLVFVPVCVGLCAVGVTEWTFAVTSLPVNLWLVREAVKFWKFEGHKGSARGLFWASVWHLPAVMVLALAQKKGMWQRVWKSVMGLPDQDDEEWEDVDDEVQTVPVSIPVSVVKQ